MDGQCHYIFCLSREDNIKMDHKETARQGGDWIYLSENRDVSSSYERRKKPSDSTKCVKFLD
jgi:hypothetical protein